MLQFISAYGRYKSYKQSTNKQYMPNQLGLIAQIILYLVPGIVIFLFLPSLIFSYFENWPYSVSIYYSFVTLSTIGKLEKLYRLIWTWCKNWFLQLNNLFICFNLRIWWLRTNISTKSGLYLKFVDKICTVRIRNSYLVCVLNDKFYWNITHKILKIFCINL